jgi:N-acetylmuramoyl-L-alanine amidase
MKRPVFSFLFALLVLFRISHAVAYEMDEMHGYVDPQESYEDRATPTTHDGTRLKKFELALKTLGIPLEGDQDFSGFPAAEELSQEAVMEHLSQIDPKGGLHRYLDLQNDSVSLFKDFFSNILPGTYLEFKQSMRETGPNTDSAPLIARLSAIAGQVRRGDEKPLAGLKIAIDPGHMGTAAVLDVGTGKMSTWDEITGKYVKYSGKKVSEGQLNLWTALLTAKELESLGAEVRLTRVKAGTVSSEDATKFDITPYLNQYYYNSLDDWMGDYLHLSDSDLVKEIVKAPKVKSIVTPVQRVQQLYIAGADLEARSKMIDAYNPDITIDIHFDASKVNQVQRSVDDIEAYVPGTFGESETGSRKVRAMALKHLLEVRRWNESVNLSGFITSSMSETLSLPLMSTPAVYMGNSLSAVRVKDGVYARNLYITRRALSSLMVYLECLHYDHVNEYTQLSILDNSGDFHGISFKYPSRLNKISTGIRAGMLNYFRAL